MLSLQIHLCGWLRVYVSPCLMIIVWLLIVEMGTQLVSSSSITFYAFVLLGGIVGLAVVRLVERVVFPTERRWATLRRAAEVPLSGIKGLVLSR